MHATGGPHSRGLIRITRKLDLGKKTAGEPVAVRPFAGARTGEERPGGGLWTLSVAGAVSGADPYQAWARSGAERRAMQAARVEPRCHGRSIILSIVSPAVAARTHCIQRRCVFICGSFVFQPTSGLVVRDAAAGQFDEANFAGICGTLMALAREYCATHGPEPAGMRQVSQVSGRRVSLEVSALLACEGAANCRFCH